MGYLASMVADSGGTAALPKSALAQSPKLEWSDWYVGRHAGYAGAGWAAAMGNYIKAILTGFVGIATACFFTMTDCHAADFSIVN
jgi:hypothetical protein